MAFSLLPSWERVSVLSMMMPVGLWRRRTPVSTLFTFWPPALERKVSQVMSAGLTSISMLSSTSGYT